MFIQQTLVLAVNRPVGLEFYYTVPNYSQRSTKTHRARNQSKLTKNNKKMWISIHIKVVSRVASQTVTKLQCKCYCLLLRFEKNLNQYVHQALDDLIYLHMPCSNYWNWPITTFGDFVKSCPNVEVKMTTLQLFSILTPINLPSPQIDAECLPQLHEPCLHPFQTITHFVGSFGMISFCQTWQFLVTYRQLLPKHTQTTLPHHLDPLGVFIHQWPS